MTTKTNQSALALTAAIFTATLLASTSIPAYASHFLGHGPAIPQNANPSHGQKGGIVVSCGPVKGCTETPPPTVYKGGTRPPTVYKGGTPPQTVYTSGTEHVVQGFGGTAPIPSPFSGPISVAPPPTVYKGGTPPQTVYTSGTEHVVEGNPFPGQVVPPGSHVTASTGAIQGTINGTLGTGNPTSGSTPVPSIPPKQIVGIANGSNCALFGCVSAPPAPTPPTGGGNPPKSGGGDHDHDHNYPGIVIEGAPGEVVVPAPVAAVPVAAAPVVAARATTAAPQVVQAPCNCLTKQTLADGSVLFQDICTKEAAIAAPQAARVR